MRRPRATFAFSPQRTTNIFSEDTQRRLADLCEIPDPVPLERYDDARAISLLAETEILITGWGYIPIGGEVLARAPKLRLIAHAAGTVKRLLTPEVLSEGVVITQAAAANALPVAEFTLAAILFSNKQVLRFRDLYAESEGITHWEMPLADKPIGNYRKAIGIVGASRIGRRVIELLRPFEFDVLLYDPLVSSEEAGGLGATLLDLDELVSRADILSLHAPLLDDTRHMISARRLSLLRDGATLINTARGELIDHSALESELISGRINAVIDVTEPEILPTGSPFYTLPNVLLTPHIAGALGVERHRIGHLIVEEIERYVLGEPLQHAVDPARLRYLA